MFSGSFRGVCVWRGGRARHHFNLSKRPAFVPFRVWPPTRLKCPPCRLCLASYRHACPPTNAPCQMVCSGVGASWRRMFSETDAHTHTHCKSPHRARSHVHALVSLPSLSLTLSLDSARLSTLVCLDSGHWTLDSEDWTLVSARASATCWMQWMKD